MTVLDSGFHIMDSRFQVLDSSLCHLNWIPIVSWIPDSLSCILDSRVQDSTFQEQNSTEFRISPGKISWIPKSGFPLIHGGNS